MRHLSRCAISVCLAIMFAIPAVAQPSTEPSRQTPQAQSSQIEKLRDAGLQLHKSIDNSIKYIVTLENIFVSLKIAYVCFLIASTVCIVHFLFVYFSSPVSLYYLIRRHGENSFTVKTYGILVLAGFFVAFTLGFLQLFHWVPVPDDFYDFFKLVTSIISFILAFFSTAAISNIEVSVNNIFKLQLVKKTITGRSVYEKAREIRRNKRMNSEVRAFALKVEEIIDVICDTPLTSEATQAMECGLERSQAEYQIRLGCMYSLGKNIPQNAVEAVEWFRMSADQGHPEAQYSLGLRYKAGQGVKYNIVLAYMWFTLSAAQGNADAEKYRSYLASCMLPSQLAEAQKLVSEWRPKIMELWKTRSADGESP